MKFRLQSIVMTGVTAVALVSILGVGYFTGNGPGANQETGLNKDLGWNALGLSSTNSPNGWAQGLVDSTDAATSFSPYGSGPQNARVTISKDPSVNGCAMVQAKVEAMYPDDIPGYDAKLGAEPRETITAVGEVCKRVGA